MAIEGRIWHVLTHSKVLSVHCGLIYSDVLAIIYMPVKVI